MKKLLSYGVVAALSLFIGMLLSDSDIANVARDTANKASDKPWLANFFAFAACR